MFVGILRLTLFLPQPGSLKSKRHLLRSAIDRVKARFNVSIAEVAENDLWQRSVVGVASVSNDHAFVNETLDKVADFVASVHGGQILVTDRSLTIESYGDELGGGSRTLAEAEEEALRAEGGVAASRRSPLLEGLQGGPDEAPPERAGEEGGARPGGSRGSGRGASPTIQKDDGEDGDA